MTSLLQLLRSPDLPPRAVLRLLPGEGDRKDLAVFVAETAKRGPVIVLARSAIELEQWVARLRSLTQVPVLKLTSADDALQLQEKDALRSAAIIVSTTQRARRGPLMTFLKGMEVELLVVDGPILSSPAGVSEDTSVSGQAIALLSDRARRTVFVVPGTMPFEWDGAVPVREISEEDFSRAADHVDVIDIPFTLTSQEIEIQSRARRLLEPYLPRLGGRTLPVTGVSDLHSHLLRLLTQRPTDASESGSADKQSVLTSAEQDAAWTVLGDLEDLTDSKLAALDAVLRRPEEDGQSWLITATIIRDASYIAEHLRGLGHKDVRVLTSLTEPQERESILRFGAPGRVVVAGRLAYNVLEQWPPRCSAIWWSPPSSRAEFEYWMSVLATARDVRVYQLTSLTPGGVKT